MLCLRQNNLHIAQQCHEEASLISFQEHTAVVYTTNNQNYREKLSSTCLPCKLESAVTLHNKVLRYMYINYAKGSSTQVHHIMLDSGVEVYMTTKLIQALPGLCGWMSVKTPVRALLHQL